MVSLATSKVNTQTKRSSVLRLGYVRLLDAAPLIVAESLGLFREAGLDVRLSREAGWASIRDKLAFGELDMAQALSPMPFAMQLGLGVAKTSVITGMVLNSNGNAITLSNRLLEDGVRDGESLRRFVRKGFHVRKLVFGVVSLYSSHHFILCRWLEMQGLNPAEDVIIAVLPPEQMVRNLISENIDGFCVGEPWNSIAVEEGVGWCPATSAQIAAAYPEKVLATTEHFYAYRPEVYEGMIAVLQRACEYCEETANTSALLKILSKSEYLNCSVKTMGHALSGPFPLGNDQYAEGKFMRFAEESGNFPDAERAGWVLDDLRQYTGAQISESQKAELISRVYRPDIYENSLHATSRSLKIEK
jgi:ABC-type nitrate/sulfonate/bicarbonate transport system substrate-binding protein